MRNVRSLEVESPAERPILMLLLNGFGAQMSERAALRGRLVFGSATANLPFASVLIR
jgi:hypothetical protein